MGTPLMSVHSSVKRNTAVVLYDLKCVASEESKNLLYKIFGYKWVNHRKDSVTLCAFNANETRNNMEPPCQGVYLSHSLVQYTPELLNELFATVKPDESTSKSNWLEAVYLAVDYLDKLECNRGIVTRQIILISDLKTPGFEDYNKLEQIITILNSNEALYLHVIGPEVEYGSSLTSSSELDSCKENMKFLKPNGNTEILQQILFRTKHSLVSNFKVGYHVFTLHTKIIGKQPWYFPLSGKPLIAFPQASRRALGSSSKTKVVEDENGSSKKLNWVNAENVNVEVDFAKLVRGIYCHSRFVPQDEEMKYKGERCFDILGFTEERFVPEYLLVGYGSYVVTIDERHDRYNDLNVLIDCLVSKKKYLIARKVYNIDTKPKFYCLVPKIEPTKKLFVMTELPYAENVKVDYFEDEIDKEAVKEAGVSPKIQEFLDSLDIDSNKGKIHFPLHVNLLHKIREEAIIDKIVGKVYDQYTPSGSDILKLDLPEELKTKMCNIFPEILLDAENENGDQDEDSDIECDEEL